jgi:hypothetical protein
MFEVVNAFKTVNQKFKPGDRLYRMMDLTPHTIETLVACGCAVNLLDKPAEPAPVKEKPAK